MPTFRRQIGASMKRIDAVREQTSRWRRGRALTRFQRGLGFKWCSNGILPQNTATVCFLDIMQGAQIIGDVSDVDDEVDGAHGSLVARHGQRVIAEIAVMHLIVIRLARKFRPTVGLVEVNLWNTEQIFGECDERWMER